MAASKVGWKGLREGVKRLDKKLMLVITYNGKESEKERIHIFA